MLLDGLWCLIKFAKLFISVTDFLKIPAAPKSGRERRCPVERVTERTGEGRLGGEDSLIPEFNAWKKHKGGAKSGPSPHTKSLKQKLAQNQIKRGF